MNATSTERIRVRLIAVSKAFSVEVAKRSDSRVSCV
jgi:hypothetical protein